MKKIFFFVCIFIYTNAFAADALLSINDKLFEVELAVTPEERSQGLMHRQFLPPGQGMLFVFPEPQIISMWMKQTLIPLDILFFDSDAQLSEIFENVPPCKLSPCKTYTNKIPARYVLELPAGSAKTDNLSPGNRLVIVKRK